jgi:hypothetical protein
LAGADAPAPHAGGLPLPKAADGRIVLAVDVSNWLRPDAPTSDDRLFCHVYGRGDRKTDQFVPGWPYSFVAALESGRTSWVALLDAVRLGLTDDATLVTAAQLRNVVERLKQAGHWRPGGPEILIVMDAGYDVTYLAHALADLPVMLLGRLRSDRVMLRDPGAPRCGPRAGDPAGTAVSSRSPGPTAGTSPTSPPARTPPATARPRRSPGTGCTPGSPTEVPGWTTRRPSRNTKPAEDERQAQPTGPAQLITYSRKTGPSPHAGFGDFEPLRSIGITRRRSPGRTATTATRDVKFFRNTVGSRFVPGVEVTVDPDVGGDGALGDVQRMRIRNLAGRSAQFLVESCGRDIGHGLLHVFGLGEGCAEVPVRCTAGTAVTRRV